MRSVVITGRRMKISERLMPVPGPACDSRAWLMTHLPALRREPSRALPRRCP